MVDEPGDIKKQPRESLLGLHQPIKTLMSGIGSSTTAVNMSRQLLRAMTPAPLSATSGLRVALADEGIYGEARLADSLTNFNYSFQNGFYFNG